MDVRGIRRLIKADLVVALGEEMRHEIVRDVVSSFGTGKQGKTHFIKDERFPGGILHTASAEGEVPNILTSDLAKSIHSVRLFRLKWEIRDGVPHGIKQEIGDPASNSAPRPFMAPIFEMWRQRKFRRFGAAFVRDNIK